VTAEDFTEHKELLQFLFSFFLSDMLQWKKIPKELGVVSKKWKMSLQSEVFRKMKLQFKQAFHISKCPLKEWRK
jgi:hypothetical protein